MLMEEFMSNVIALRTTVPTYGKTNLRIVESRKNKINLRKMSWYKRLYQLYCKYQDDIRNKKIQALKDEAYNFYLDLYLTGTKNTVDIADFLYREGLTHCQYAGNMAEMEITKIIETNRVDKCYKLLKEKQKSRKMARK